MIYGCNNKAAHIFIVALLVKFLGCVMKNSEIFAFLRFTEANGFLLYFQIPGESLNAPVKLSV